MTTCAVHFAPHCAATFGQRPVEMVSPLCSCAAGIALEQIYESRQFRPASLRLIRQRRSKGEVPSGKPDWTVSVKNIDRCDQVDQPQQQQPTWDPALAGALLLRASSSPRETNEYVGLRPSAEALRWSDKSVNAIRPSSSSGPEPTPATSARNLISTAGTRSFHPESPVSQPIRRRGRSAQHRGRRSCPIGHLFDGGVSPPLSVGLFGNWAQARASLSASCRGACLISQQARSGRMQKEVPFYKHVVQIEFNAWNYSEGNLWATRVQHILENLRTSMTLRTRSGGCTTRSPTAADGARAAGACGCYDEAS